METGRKEMVCRGRVFSSFACLLFVLSLLLLAGSFLGPIVSAETSGDWRTEFEEICMMTVAADSLPVEELQALIERSDKLLPKIEASDDPASKVYVFRLKKCRALFEYIIELRKAGR